MVVIRRVWLLAGCCVLALAACANPGSGPENQRANRGVTTPFSDNAGGGGGGGGGGGY